MDLIGSFARNIYVLWKFVEDASVDGPVVTREQPYPDIRWFFIPSLMQGAVLTRVKAGIVAILAMRRVQLEPSWPGHIHIKITESGQRGTPPTAIGQMTIINYRGPSSISASNTTGSVGLPSALTRTAGSPHGQPSVIAHAMTDPSPVADSSNGTSTAARTSEVPLHLERRWLDCYTMFFLVVMQKSFSEKMEDDPQYRAPERGVNIVGEECGNASPRLPQQSRDTIHVAIYPRDRTRGQPPLTWDRVALAMLDWIDRIRGDPAWYLGYTIDSPEGPLLGINIRLNS